MRGLLKKTVLGAALILAPLAALATDGMHHLALQISDGDEGKMVTVLNVASNVARFYSERGEEVEIRIVAFNAGLNMLREDKSPVLDRLESFRQSMPNVSFAACQNTIDAMAQKEGKTIPVIATADHVAAGAVELITLDEQGWTIIRP